MRKSAALMLAVAMMAGTAQAKAPPRYGPLAYSNGCFEEESGDFAGARLMLWRLHDGDEGVFEWSEGPMEASRAYRIEIGKDGHISFKINLNEFGSPEEQDVSGVISEEAVEITFFGKTHRLPRLTDFSAPMPKCK